MGAHEFRYEFQYRFIPKSVADVNDGYLPSIALHMAKGMDIWEEYEWEDGFYIDRQEVESHHTIVFYNFPEPEQIQDALYGAVLIDNTTGKAEYYTLECGYMDNWILGSTTQGGHRNFGRLDSRERSDFFKWVTDKIYK